MTISIKHKFTSAKADGGDATLIRPSNWNDTHDLTMATASLIGRYSAGTGAAQELTVSSNLTLGSGVLDLSSTMLSTINGKAALASPAFTGTPTAPTPAVSDDSTKLATTAFVNDALPAGVVVAYASGTVPTGWLECNGAAVSRSTYAALFAAIGITYGAGNGSTTFNLPETRGEFIRGWDNSRGVDSTRGIGTWQDHMLQDHSHRIQHGEQSNTQTGGSSPRVTQLSGASAWDTNSSSMPIGNHGIETRPRNLAMMYIIRAF